MYKINIYNNQNVIGLRMNIRRTRGILKSILGQERQPVMALNFVLVDDKQIRRLNRKYLGRNRITDVIAFPLPDEKGLPMDNIKGEVAICVEEAYRQSRKRNIPLNKELLLYCIHGLLHLIGYDDRTEKDRLRMERKQLNYLKS